MRQSNLPPRQADLRVPVDGPPVSAGEKAALGFAKKMGVNYPILLGKETVAQSYGGIGVLPTTFFLDRNGRVIAREFGLQSRSIFVAHIKDALGPAATTQALK